MLTLTELRYLVFGANEYYTHKKNLKINRLIFLKQFRFAEN